jgi:flagellar biosynthesis GTPase FlhF
VDACEEKLLEIWAKLDTRDKNLDAEHDKKIAAINQSHDNEEGRLQKQQAEYAADRRFGHGDEATRELKANEETRQERLAAENEKYAHDKAQVAKEKQDLNQYVEDRLQPERNRMEEQHARETAACEELRKSSDKLPPDINFEKRVGDWIRTAGPVAEKAYNELGKQFPHLGEIKVDWKAVGDGVETGLTIISAKTDVVWPMGPKEFDQAMLKGVKEVQDKEWADMAAAQKTLLGERDKGLEKKPEREFELPR